MLDVKRLLEKVEEQRRMTRDSASSAAMGESGVKFDKDKLRMDLIPPDAMQALARVLTDGAAKYGDRNWEKGMDWRRPYAALLRHLFAWWGGQDKDPESGHSHLWHVLTNAVFLTSYEMRRVGKDDRLVMGEVEK